MTMTTTESDPKKARSWLVLLLAGAFEVGYALSVGGSEGFTVIGWSISAFVFFLLTLFCLSVALKTIDVGIGYAVWAGIGAVGAAILGPIFFNESLTPVRAVWLAVIIGGLVWLKLADSLTFDTKKAAVRAGATRASTTSPASAASPASTASPASPPPHR